MSNYFDDQVEAENEDIVLEETPVSEDDLIDGIVEEDAPVAEEPVIEEAPVEKAPVKEPVIITTPSYSGSEEVQALGTVADGVIGATKKPRAKKAPAVKTQTVEEEKVAIYADKNYYWGPAGKIYRGYNIVSKAKADLWLTKTGVRLATPEEVAKEFGV